MGKRGVVASLIMLAGALFAGCHGGAESRHQDDASAGRDGAADFGLPGGGGAGGTTGAGGAPNTGKAIAAACSADAECGSGYCFDGVCCRSECKGPCQSCAIEGSVGTCANTPVGTDPRGDCADEGAGSCGLDGTCDGTGACALYAAGTICRAQSCAGATVTHAARCDGAGECGAPTSDSCGQYLCNTSGSCRSTCATSADCVAGAACVNGSCGPKPPGATCTAAADCASAHCEQGVCCATACAGTCKSCAITGSEGQCIDVPSGGDPLGQCADEGGATCGRDGTCDGMGACRNYVGGTPCGSASCSAGAAVAGRTCNGAGTCLVVLPVPCSPYVCGAAACRTSCNGDADCLAPNVCVASVCGPRATGGTGGGAGGTTGAGGITGAGGGGTTGAAGTTAAAGTSGGAGTTGGRGGTSGAAGTNAAAGTTGAAGTAAAGTSGAAGTTGAAGMTGVAGTTAAAGTTGAAGTTAVAGTTGAAGTTAAAGSTGAAGTASAGGRGGIGGGAGTAACPGYVFCDDFENGNANGWTPNGGTWSVVTDGSRVYQGGNGNAMSLAGQATWTDQTIQARMKVLQFGGTSTSYRAGIVARATDASDLYVFAMDASGAMRLLKGTSSPSGTGATGTCGKVIVGGVANAWYTLRMRIQGTGADVRLTTFLDGVMVHDCQTSAGTLPAGQAGVYIYGPNTIAEFDDVRISLP